MYFGDYLESYADIFGGNSRTKYAWDLKLSDFTLIHMPNVKRQFLNGKPLLLWAKSDEKKPLFTVFHTYYQTFRYQNTLSKNVCLLILIGNVIGRIFKNYQRSVDTRRFPLFFDVDTRDVVTKILKTIRFLYTIASTVVGVYVWDFIPSKRVTFELEWLRLMRCVRHRKRRCC